MRTPVHRELDAWGPIVDRMADVECAWQFGDDLLTEREYRALKALYGWVFLNTPVK